LPRDEARFAAGELMDNDFLSEDS